MWFAAASPGGSTATLQTSLVGYDVQSSSLTVYGTPTWFGARLTQAGMAGYMTSDQAGSVAAAAMRAGDPFYLQLYAHTGGYALGSFEARLVVDTAVCELVPASGGAFSSSYEGALQGELSGLYQIELLHRFRKSGAYFTKYQRLSKLSPLTGTHGHLGWVRLRYVGGVGPCLISATITTFYESGGSSYIPGVSLDDPISLHGNSLVPFSDVQVGVLGELTGAAIGSGAGGCGGRSPVVNTAYLLGSSSGVGVEVRTMSFSSPDGYTSSTACVTIDETQPTGQVSTTVASGSFSHAVFFSVVRPPAPSLELDDATLQRLPGTCSGYQRTWLRAYSGGVDLVRLLDFGSTDVGVAIVDEASVPGRATVIGVGAGSASIYVRSVAFASVEVAVDAAPVELTALRAGVVTGVEWPSVSSPAGPYAPSAFHRLVSETSVGWLYVWAHFADGSSRAFEGAVSTAVAAPLNESVTVTHDGGSGPHTVRVRSGASSIADLFEVSTCLGDTTALCNVTLPGAISATLTERNSPSNRLPLSLVPQTNVAEEFSQRYSWADLQVAVLFADGSTRTMQMDSRAAFDISHSCGSFADAGSYKRLTLASACRTASVTVSVTVTIGGTSVSDSIVFAVEWLAAVQLELFYKDGATPYTSSQLRYRYDCTVPVAPYHPSFHSLRARTRGTLSSGGVQWLASVAWTASGGSLGGSGTVRTLTVASAGAVTIQAVPSPNPDALSSSRALTALAEADPYTFAWSLNLPSSTVHRPYLAEHPTVATLFYASGPYTETMSDEEKRSLISFTSSDVATVVVSDRGWLQPQRSQMTSVDVTAAFCDGYSIVGPMAIFSNLQVSHPLDYDLGSTYGPPIAYTAGDAQLCVPIYLYTAFAVHNFQFVLRFDRDILDCSSTSCGTFSPGTDWSAFGSGKVAMAPDRGQIDFLTLASLADFNRMGTLDIGTLCLDVIGTGTLRLQVQMQDHNDVGGLRSCSSGSHLYEDSGSCFSRTPDISFPVTCTGGCRRRDRALRESLSAVSTSLAFEGVRRELSGGGGAARAPPFNIDTHLTGGNRQQTNIRDCEYLGLIAAGNAGDVVETQNVIDGVASPELAVSYNPTLDFYSGTETPLIDNADALYCLHYMAKKKRFVYNASLTCDGYGTRITIDVAGGKDQATAQDQATHFVAAPAESTRVLATVDQDCSGLVTVLADIELNATGGTDATGRTGPYESTLASACTFRLTSFSVQVTGEDAAVFPWPDSSAHDRRLSPWQSLPMMAKCADPTPPLPPPPSPPPSPPPPSPPPPSPPPPLVDSDLRINFAVVGTLVPLMGALLLFFLAVRVLVLVTPYFTAGELLDYAKQWKHAVNATGLRMIDVLRERVRKEAASASPETPLRNGTFGDALSESIRLGLFFSPLQVRALAKTEQLSAVQVDLMQRELVHSYSLALSHEELVQSYVRAFFARPAVTLVSGLELMQAARAEAARLRSSDTLLAEDVAQLGERIELAVAGCIRAFSGHDDLIDQLLSSRVGKKAADLVIRTQAVKVVALPEIQRYLQLIWMGRLEVVRDKRAEANALLGRAGPRERWQRAMLRGVQQAQPPSVQQPSPSRRRRTSSSRSIRSVRDAVVNNLELRRNKAAERRHLSRIIRSSPWLMMPLHLIACPLVGLWPPLETLGRHSRRAVLAAFCMPPSLRFYLYEISNMVFLLVMTLSDLPITRNEAQPLRDFSLLCATNTARKTRLLAHGGVRPLGTCAAQQGVHLRACTRLPCAHIGMPAHVHASRSAYAVTPAPPLLTRQPVRSGCFVSPPQGVRFRAAGQVLRVCVGDRRVVLLAGPAQLGRSDLGYQHVCQLLSQHLY